MPRSNKPLCAFYCSSNIQIQFPFANCIARHQKYSMNSSSISINFARFLSQGESFTVRRTRKRFIYYFDFWVDPSRDTVARNFLRSLSQLLRRRIFDTRYQVDLPKTLRYNCRRASIARFAADRRCDPPINLGL